MSSDDPRTFLFVSGLPEETTIDLLKTVFTSFGELHEVTLPMDPESNKPKGFAFLKFELVEDADDAIDNMDDSEIFGRTIKVTRNKSKPLHIDNTSNAIWNSEDWMKNYVGKTLENSENKPETSKVTNPIVRDETQIKIPVVFFDISIETQYVGRMIFRLRRDIVPKTAENFRRLCLQNRGRGFKQSSFHRIINGFMIQGGDFTNHNGSGGRSIYGVKFDDENFDLKHTQMGILSMANSGPNTNGSQFFITLNRTEWLDGKHVVFGMLADGFDVLRKIEECGSDSGNPTKKVVIEDCGELFDFDV